MDLLYTVNRKAYSKSFSNQESLYDGQSLCTLSCRNIAAFTTVTELEDNNGKTWGSHVYVVDLNMPWHVHKVLSSKHSITALEWDLPGDKLVVADSAGNVQLWMFKDHVLNDWMLIGCTCFVGEHILGAAWFHNGKKTGLVAEKKDSIHYSEKFNHLPFAPSVRQFGGRAAEGVLVVSTTGMVGAVMITKDFQNPICSSTESLGSTRHRITSVDLCYGKNGHFLVAVSSGSICLPVRCYRVLVRKTDEKCTITSQALPSFFLQDGAPKDNTCTNVTHLKFVVREDADSLVVAANSENGGFVEVWELREKSQPVHKLFQPKSLEPFKTVVWQHQSQYRCQSPVTAITTTKLPIVTTLPPPSYVIVALADSSIHCLNRDCLKEVSYSSLNMAWRQDEPSNKYFKSSISLAHMDISWLGCVLLACDTYGSLYLYKLLPDGGPSLTLGYACTLLEYCLVTGLDWLDVLLCLRASMIETLCERLDASYTRQTQPIQQYLYVQFLCIKTSLYRMLVSGQNRAADLSSLLMIHSVATAFKSLLRPSDLISHDKGPAESLAAVITEPISDVDKVLLHLDPKEFTVEPSTLQSLQQLIQWVADLALNLLARLPEQRMQMKSGGYELLKDHKALNTVRELLVIIRIWGLLRPLCLPVFLRSADNLDVLALLFRLLSKLVQPNGETQQQIDDSLIDDCCLLPNQIMIPQLHQGSSITALTSPVLFYQSLPLQLEYGIEPEQLLFTPELNPVEGCMHSGQVVDTIRHLYLGKQPLLVKQCTRYPVKSYMCIFNTYTIYKIYVYIIYVYIFRCGGKVQVQNMTRTAAIRAWDQRWTRACRCGGFWRIHKTCL
ncbi:mediator of RNA polymerase II transcription subunit 16 isoform X1 [Vespula pensylvanica]|uniref:mediator of RNA polymerase II transcription subunit 16 isoform X1 n=1 Tax=Vespula pensylvanica TaxID=30213 RepID=UPI001CBA53FB|nr:mediator of RNA polymerase II transcription subunit 16 isoform X1 [Vespula pensylvanica]XP_043684833.1 mediator of RNA polymerase II transcription subunit 16 isoform X1 [Vespula pensylvanica]